MNGINNIKTIIKKALEVSNMTNILDVVLESTPTYQVSSKDHFITVDDHQKFIHALEILAKDPENGIYFKQNVPS